MLSVFKGKDRFYGNPKGIRAKIKAILCVLDPSNSIPALSSSIQQESRAY